MTPEQYESYRKLRATPGTFDAATHNKKIMQSTFDAQVKARSEAHARFVAATRPAHEALRSAFSAIPGVADAVKMARPPEPTQLEDIGPLVVPTDPIVRLGSIHLVDVKPFLGLDHIHDTGTCIVSVTADGNTGEMSFICDTGISDSGHAQVWCAIGRNYVTPGAGVLRFSSSPSFAWSCSWASNWWREAAGTLFIGQVMNRFQLNGTYLDTPVSTQNYIYSYDDNNLSDGGDQSGVNSGYNLSSSVVCDASVNVSCWVWIGCFSNADGSDNQSSAFNRMRATVPSLTIDFW